MQGRLISQNVWLVRVLAAAVADAGRVATGSLCSLRVTFRRGMRKQHRGTSVGVVTKQTARSMISLSHRSMDRPDIGRCALRSP